MAAVFDNGVARLIHADARAIPLPEKSVHCVVTSPPYWGLRNYSLGEWTGGDPDCEHAKPQPTRDAGTGKAHSNTDHAQEAWPNNTCGRCGAVLTPEGIGLESSFSDWLENMRAVAREVWRVLRDDGTFWLNIGDAYSSKNLIGMPWRVAFALQEDGWIIRSDIIWHKPNPMPESVRDRPTSSYEHIFLLTKQGVYFYDADAIRAQGVWKRGGPGRVMSHPDRGGDIGIAYGPQAGTSANSRNVWAFVTQGRMENHFASFPDELPRRCILAGTSEHGVCAECGAPWERVVDRETMEINRSSRTHPFGHTRPSGTMTKPPSAKTTAWQPSCDCDADVVPATVLDPFVGSGTTCVVAQRLGRNSIGIDLNAEYLGIARSRIAETPLRLF